MFSNILVPLDGSALAERALPVAEWLAHAGSAHLVLIRAVQASTFPGVDAREAQVAALADAQAYLDEHSEQLTSQGLTVETGVPYGEAATEILEEVRLRKPDVVVMATHGRSGLGRWLYGSVADEVLHRSPVPVVMVSPASVHSDSPDTPPVILVPLDGSEVAVTSLGPASELANQLGACVVLLNIVSFPPYGLYGEAGGYIAFDPDKELLQAHNYLTGIAENLKPTLKDVRVRAEVGNPSDCIAQVARDERVTMIVMATHGRTGIARAVLGSVATGVLGRASVPLMLVPRGLDVGRADSTCSDARPLEPSDQEDPVVYVAFSRSELDLLQRGLGELLYKPGSDLECSAQVRELTGRLKRVESSMAADLATAKGQASIR